MIADVAKRRRLAVSYDAKAVLILCTCVTGPQHATAPALFAPYLLLILWSVLVSLALSLVQLASGASLGERAWCLKRIRTDGGRLRLSNWLRREWPLAWLTTGCVVFLFMFVTTREYAFGTTFRYVEIMQRRSLLLGLLAVVPPLFAWIWRYLHGDGTRVIDDPMRLRAIQGRNFPHGFDGVLDPATDNDADEHALAKHE